MKPIFISFEDQDSSHRDALDTWLSARVQGARPVSARKDGLPRSDDAIRTFLRQIMQPCDAVVLILGPNTYRSRWVAREMAVASSLQKPTLLVARPDGLIGPLPEGMPRRCEILSWPDGLGTLASRYP